MEPHVFAAVLAAAAMHAGWNAVLKLKLEPFLAMTLVTGAAGLVAVPGLLAFGWPVLPAWPWLEHWTGNRTRRLLVGSDV